MTDHERDVRVWELSAEIKQRTALLTYLSGNGAPHEQARATVARDIKRRFDEMARLEGLPTEEYDQAYAEAIR